MTTIDRRPCPAPRHGRYSAYVHHRCICADTREDRNREERAYRSGIRRVVTATVTVRQLQALLLAGHSYARLGRELGTDPRGIRLILNQRSVRSRTAEDVATLARKLRHTPGDRPALRLRRDTSHWLPWDAWRHGDITDPCPEAEITALFGWLAHTTTPDSDHGPLAQLLHRIHDLTPEARLAMTRKAHAMRVRGITTNPVLEGERVHQRDKARARARQPRLDLRTAA